MPHTMMGYTQYGLCTCVSLLYTHYCPIVPINKAQQLRVMTAYRTLYCDVWRGLTTILSSARSLQTLFLSIVCTAFCPCSFLSSLIYRLI